MSSVRPKYLGFKNTSVSYGNYEVTGYKGNGRYEVTFYNGFKTMSSSKEILNGKIKNKLHPTIDGVGYLGEGLFKVTYTTNGKKNNTPAYEVWLGIIKRCYNPKCVAYNLYGGRGISVASVWHNYQNFALWYYQKGSCKAKLAVDKDLLFHGNKVYSPDTCTLVPYAINNLFVGGLKKGVYYKKDSGMFVAQIHTGDKTANDKPKQTFLGYHLTEKLAMDTFLEAKIKYVKEVAVKYENVLDKRVYTNLTDPSWVTDYILCKNKGE